VDCAGGVSTVPPGSSIGSSNRWKSCRGVSSDAHTSGGRVGAIASIAVAIAKTGVSVAWVAAISQNVGISLSFPLGDMDDTSRVGNVTSSTGVSSSDSRDGSRGSSEGGERGRGGDVGVAGSKGSNSCKGGDSSSNRSSIAKTGIAVAKTSVSQTSVAKTIGTVEGIGLSLPLGNMDDSGRVGNIATGSSISSSNGRDGSGGKAGNVHGGGRGDTGVAGSIRGSKTSIAKTIASITSVTQASISSTVAKEVGVGLSSDCRSEKESCQELVHVGL